MYFFSNLSLAQHGLEEHEAASMVLRPQVHSLYEYEVVHYDLVTFLCV